MKWVKVLPLAELPEGERAVIQIEDKEILLLHYEGQIFAVQSKCPHMGAPLKRAKIEAGALVCPVHRSAFDLQTGDAKEWTPWPPVVGKLMGAISGEKALPTYPTRIEEGNVWVEI
ncbi:MAG: Rieske (2Fe-2S) protein [Anaerolineae bacterium]|jgi:nitrite reductase/ring-hydroxylating ferredoxin subunit|nr:Rieske (2Fe-2S) protein [Anaerolineae bacterium]